MAIETFFIKELNAKGIRWLVKGRIGKSGKANCSICKERINTFGGEFRVWDSVPKDQLAFVPAAVLKASAAIMKKAELAAKKAT